ncbi:hypothetical protein M409DRAFT_26285, partial [Zasmidium cellare ATCC 36951]
TPDPTPTPNLITTTAPEYLALLTDYNVTSFITTSIYLTVPPPSSPSSPDECTNTIIWIFDLTLNGEEEFPIKGIGLFDLVWVAVAEVERWVAVRFEVEFNALAALGAEEGRGPEVGGRGGRGGSEVEELMGLVEERRLT